MKVTVCFRDIKVVVPCGNGSGLVKDLLEEAIARYRKAQSKNAENGWLTLKTVKLLLSDGGILDLDDKIIDVIDDKDQIQAIFEGNHRMLEGLSDNNGDGMSGSSLGTCSPDIFGDNITDRICSGKDGSDLLVSDRRDIIITEQDFLADSGLRVRRGSEPVLCTSSDFESSGASGADVSAEFPICKGAISRKDPLGSTSSSGLKNGHSASVGQIQVATGQDVVSSASKKPLKTKDKTDKQKNELIVVLPKSNEALGIHVVPELDNADRNIGLLIGRIEPGGRADRDGRLRQGDVITEINFQNLFEVEFSKAQDIFRSAFLAPELQIKLLRPVNLDVRSAGSNVAETADKNGSVTTAEENRLKKIPPVVPARNPKTQLTSKMPTRLTMQTLPIELMKGAQGLGFSVTTHGNRDNGCCPIYIKTIFSVGAAAEDGHLKPGDVLLEINGISLTDKTKAEAVRMLRNFPRGTTIQLLVSRALTSGDDTAHEWIHETNKPVQRPLSTLGFFPSSTSSYSDRTEEEIEYDNDEDHEEEETVVKTNLIGNRKDGKTPSLMQNGFGSLSNLTPVGADADDDDDPNFFPDKQTGGKPAPERLGTSSSTLQKSRKSISMDDLRRNFGRGAVEASFDDDVDFPATPFHKMRDFNQSFRAAVIDKTYNEPAAKNITSSAKFSAASQKIEKLRMAEDKKSKNKKDHDRGSGRKFGWLFRFGKGRKSDSDRVRSAQSEIPNRDENTQTVPAKELPPSEAPLPGYQKGQVQQTSHPPRSSDHRPVEGVRHAATNVSQLHKEDYMITAHPTVVHRNPQGYARQVTPEGVYNAPLSYDEHPRGHYGQSRYLAREGYDPSHEQFYHGPQHYNRSGSSSPSTTNAYFDRGYLKTVPSSMDHSQRPHPQEHATAHGGYQQQRLLFYQDSDPAYRQRHSPQLLPPGVVQPPHSQGYISPSSQLKHYYQRDKFDAPHQRLYHQPIHENIDLYRQPKSYGQDPSWDQCPLDLSRYAVKAQDRGDVSHGYRDREYGHQTRLHANPDLQIQNSPFSQYAPYKNISCGILTNSNVSRGRESSSKPLYQKSRAVVEQLQLNDLYQAQLQQNNAPVSASATSSRW